MTSSRGRFFIKTWGCAMNVHDEQKMASCLEGDGWQRATRAAEADLILLNTCSVREKSAEKLFTFLGRLKRFQDRSPGKRIGVTGCVAQQEGEHIFKRAPHVDLVIGPRRIGRIAELVRDSGGPARQVDTALDDLTAIYWDGGRATRGGSKAYVTIMEGCNMGCTFCIVPQTRGREIHRPFASIVAECRRRVAEGITEIEFLGQTVNAYRHGGRAFHHLLDEVARISGLQRLRFTSSHPAFFTPDTATVMAAHETICSHLHLPVQSGSDRMLKAMRRGHTVADYRRRLDDLRNKIPNIALSTDIIAGYPGETDADFARTLELVEDVRYSQVFAFKYSPRPATPAVELDDDIPEAVKGERLARLFALQDRISLSDNRKMVGEVMPVLFDGLSRLDDQVAAGRTECNRVVNAPGLAPADVAGQVVLVRITAAGTHSLAGVAARA
ncbi:MAG: tRNA (N6-isopentenyl adenosine(37)-C2)-methylthiotransferase MiaB [Acidobacteriota bacterium]